MTLNDIIVSALAQLDRTHDAQTVEIYRNRFTQYANTAQNDLALSLALTRTETLPGTGGEADLGSLERRCLRVESVRQLGREVPYRRGSTPDLLLLPYAEEAEITYRFAPKALLNAGDVPEIDEVLHPLIVTYVVACERMGGDAATQHGANVYLSLYNAAKAKLRGYLKGSDSFAIVNRY